MIAAGRFTVSGDGTVATIGRLAVAPDRQGEGLGRLLLSALEDAAPPSVREYRLFTGEHSFELTKMGVREAAFAWRLIT